MSIDQEDGRTNSQSHLKRAQDSGFLYIREGRVAEVKGVVGTVDSQAQKRGPRKSVRFLNPFVPG